VWLRKRREARKSSGPEEPKEETVKPQWLVKEFEPDQKKQRPLRNGGHPPKRRTAEMGVKNVKRHTCSTCKKEGGEEKLAAAKPHKILKGDSGRQGRKRAKKPQGRFLVVWGKRAIM